VARIRIIDPAPAGRIVFIAYPRAGAQHQSVRDLARIAREHGRTRQESLQKLQ